MKKGASFLLSVLAVLGLLSLSGLAIDVISPPAPADTISGIVTFSAGGVIRAADFNTNFTAITTAVNGNLDDVNIKDDGITGSTKIADGTVVLANMDTDSVNSAKIVDSSIVTADISDGTVGEPDLNIADSPAVGDVLGYDDAAGHYEWFSSSCASFIYGHYDSSGTAPGTIYYFGYGEDLRDTTASNVGVVSIPKNDMYSSSLWVEINTAPGAGKTWVFTTNIEGTGTGSQSCTIADTDTSCEDTANGFLLQQGDRLSVNVTSTGTPASFAEIWFGMCLSFSDHS